MEEEAICPHCGHALDETIPLALVGSIQVKCPFCDMVYSFQRYEDVDSIGEESESYLSAGPFGRKLVFSDEGQPREGNPCTMKFSCLVLWLFGPIVVFGIYWLILFLISLF